MIKEKIDFLNNFEENPKNNKVIKEFWKIIWPYGTCPKQIQKVKNDLILVMNKLDKNKDKKIEENMSSYDKSIYLREVNGVENFNKLYEESKKNISNQIKKTKEVDYNCGM